MLKTLADYLFNTRPSAFALFGTFFLISAFLALIIPIGWGVVVKETPRFYSTLARKSRRLLLWYGIVSLILYFIRFQRIPYLSMRILLWLWCIGFAVLCSIVIYKEWRKIPIRREKELKDMKRKQYFKM